MPMCLQYALHEKYQSLKFFRSVFSRIRTEYGKIRRYSVHVGKYGPEKLRNKHFSRIDTLKQIISPYLHKAPSRR